MLVEVLFTNCEFSVERTTYVNGNVSTVIMFNDEYRVRIGELVQLNNFLRENPLIVAHLRSSELA